MGDYILFSPVGGTDPIANFRDGALLHICRKYRPKKAVLYLSAEMLAHQEKDNRYYYCMDKLNEYLGITIERVLEERPDLKDVQYFDRFYQDFAAIIRRLRAEHPEDTLILNISSGSPAMKSALVILSVFEENEHILPVQVDTPAKSQNERAENKDRYNAVEQWELNDDNDPERYYDRCHIYEGPHLNAMITKRILCDFLDTYDYVAAQELGESLQGALSEQAQRLLRAAAYRLQLNHSGVDKALAGMEDIRVSLPSDKRNVAEYLLGLQIKQKRGDFADFLRGLTPVIVKLYEMCLKEKFHINIYDYYETKKKGDDYVYRLTREKMEKTEPGRAFLAVLDNEFAYQGGYRDSIPTSAHLSKLLEAQCGTDSAILENCRLLRSVEENARNVAAHTIVSVTDEEIKNRVGFDSARILKALRQMAGVCGLGSVDWASYDLMNERIRKEVNQVSQ